jgi:hypothetical protein
MATPPGWYPQEGGIKRYWSGSQWTEATVPDDGDGPVKQKQKRPLFLRWWFLAIAAVLIFAFGAATGGAAGTTTTAAAPGPTVTITAPAPAPTPAVTKTVTKTVTKVPAECREAMSISAEFADAVAKEHGEFSDAADQAAVDGDIEAFLTKMGKASETMGNTVTKLSKRLNEIQGACA